MRSASLPSPSAASSSSRRSKARARPADVAASGVSAPTRPGAQIALAGDSESSVSTLAPSRTDRWALSPSSCTSSRSRRGAAASRRGSPARAARAKTCQPIRYDSVSGSRSTRPCSASVASVREVWLLSLPMSSAKRTTPRPPRPAASRPASACSTASPRARPDVPGFMRSLYFKMQPELYNGRMFTNAMPRYEPLAPESIELVERGWKRLVSEIGVQFDEPRALELFRAAGQQVEGDLVRFDPEFVLEQVAKSPSEFTLHARNPEHDLHIGGNRMMFLPAQGPPFVRIGEERRDGTLADLVQLIKLAQMQPELDTPGGNICEPDDVPLDSRHLVQTLALIVHSDKIFKGMPMSRTAGEDTLRMAEILAGGREALEHRPVLFANVNVNSPLRYDVRMLEALLAYGSAGQPVIVTPFLLMGAMAPVSIPSALAQQMAEVLTGIALLQLVRPGT